MRYPMLRDVTRQRKKEAGQQSRHGESVTCKQVIDSINRSQLGNSSSEAKLCTRNGCACRSLKQQRPQLIQS